MRTFIAVDLPQHIKEKIAQIETSLKECQVHAKWVNPNNCHLTLKFLGEVTEEQVGDIKNAIDDVAACQESVEVQLESFGFFPNQKRPRVFFVSINQEAILKNIARMLEERLESIGFSKEKRFKSHITLARFKGIKNIDCLKREMKEIPLGEVFTIDAITLFRSTLTSTGPLYAEIFKTTLKK
ncbi:MAG: RNA 2',3'-cyclic phosphodiesterase [Candidatus Omnitrophota bacterium]|nr:MAG: RNA 2',3'-cyclic phosphodiesterase [Candidatus Omnitrophota bacterium]